MVFLFSSYTWSSIQVVINFSLMGGRSSNTLPPGWWDFPLHHLLNWFIRTVDGATDYYVGLFLKTFFQYGHDFSVIKTLRLETSAQILLYRSLVTYLV